MTGEKLQQICVQLSLKNVALVTQTQEGKGILVM
jgi:hypothetical protein